MNSIRAVFLFVFFFLVQISFAQKKKSPKLSKADNTTVTNLQAHINYLANDKLEVALDSLLREYENSFDLTKP